MAQLSDPMGPAGRRERLVRTLTFWLRPGFVLRAVSRFQKVAGFDRAVALASAALTATIPLTILTSSISSHFGGKDTAERIIARYELTGSGAQAARALFAAPPGTSVSIGVIGFLFLLLTALSYSRAMQRMFEQTWELDALSVRNTFNGLLWIAGFAGYLAVIGLLHTSLGHGPLELSAALLGAPVTAFFLLWTGRVLSAKRITLRDLLPFSLLGAVLLALYSMGMTVYLPHLFSTYSSRYGVIGAVFAMISAIFCAMVVIVGSAAAGREVDEELDRIRNGDRPADDEVEREWREITEQARSRWEVLRAQIQARRRRT